MHRILVLLLFLMTSLPIRAEENKTLDFVHRAMNSTGCHPSEHTCSIDTQSGADFLMFLQNCNILHGWIINYPSKDGQIVTSISLNSQGNCAITAIDSKTFSVLKQCALTYEQYQNVANDEMINAMQQYDTNGVATPDVIKAMTPVAQCLGEVTVNRVNTFSGSK